VSAAELVGILWRTNKSLVPAGHHTTIPPDPSNPQRSHYFDDHVTVPHDKFLIIKPTRCTNFSSLFWNKILHVSDSSSVHHQEFFRIRMELHGVPS